MPRTLPLLAAGTDLVTRSWAQAMLAGQPPLRLLGETLRLHLGFSPGVAFSLFAGSGLFVPLLNLATNWTGQSFRAFIIDRAMTRVATPNMMQDVMNEAIRDMRSSIDASTLSIKRSSGS